MNESHDDLVSWDSSPDKREETRGRQELGEDVIWANVGAPLEQDEFELEPLDPVVERNRLAKRESYLTLGVVYEGEDDEDHPPRYQFTLRDLIILNSAIAVVFALMRILAPSLTAGTLGAATLLAAVVLAVYQPDNKRVQLAWWVMLAIYLVASLVAVVVGQ